MKCRPLVHARFTAVSWLIALVYRVMINDVILWMWLVYAGDPAQVSTVVRVEAIQFCFRVKTTVDLPVYCFT